MTRKSLWRSIAQTMTKEIADGHFKEGDKLPTEGDLARRFGVNRHTVRRALTELQDSGVIHTRRGAGSFVMSRPSEYPIGARVRFHRNLEAAGRLPGKTVLALQTRPATGEEAEALNIAQGEEVHCYEGLSLADDTPVALFRSIFPAARFPQILRDLEETRSVTASFARAGLEDYIRDSTRLTAQTATPTQAAQLKVRDGAPLLMSVSVNADAGGQPVEFGQTWFVGERITLVVGQN